MQDPGQSGLSSGGGAGVVVVVVVGRGLLVVGPGLVLSQQTDPR